MLTTRLIAFNLATV